MKKILLFMAAGAGLAFLFDPDNGARRRDALQRKLGQQSDVAQPSSTYTSTGR